MALRHLIVVDQFAVPVGIITRANLTNISKAHFKELFLERKKQKQKNSAMDRVSPDTTVQI